MIIQSLSIEHKNHMFTIYIESEITPSICSRGRIMDHGHDGIVSGSGRRRPCLTGNVNLDD